MIFDSIKTFLNIQQLIEQTGEGGWEAEPGFRPEKVASQCQGECRLGRITTCTLENLVAAFAQFCSPHPPTAPHTYILPQEPHVFFLRLLHGDVWISFLKIKAWRGGDCLLDCLGKGSGSVFILGSMDPATILACAVADTLEPYPGSWHILFYTICTLGHPLDGSLCAVLPWPPRL